MQTCEINHYLCVTTGANFIEVTKASIADCNIGKPIVQSKWQCDIGVASISGNVSTAYEPVTAHGIGQFMVLILVCFGVVLAYCGFFLGSYIYRK